ncbi:MAG: PLP-dependent aminotransferase family protein [Vicinamibacterales bacterium]
MLPVGDAPGVDFDFGVGVPDYTRFPLTVWRRLVTRELRDSAQPMAAYADPAGHPALRAAIARHLGVSRAVHAAADDVVVTTGAQQAFDLIGRVLIDPGAGVAMEDPGYGRPRALFATLGARILPVPVDAEGLVVEAIPVRARLVYVTPSHQFPLGVTMSLRRRAALLDWAERRGGVVIEDDYDSEFRFGGRPLDPLQSLDLDRAACSTSARSPRCCCPDCDWASSSPRPVKGRFRRPASWPTGTATSRRRAPWHASSTRAAWRGTSGPFRGMRGALRAHRRGDRGRLSRWLRLMRRRRDSTYGRHARPVSRPARRRHRRGGAGARRARDRAGRLLRRPSDQGGLVLGFGGIALSRIDEGCRLARAIDDIAR